MLDSVFFPHFFYFIRELNLYTPLVTIFHIQNRYQLSSFSLSSLSLSHSLTSLSLFSLTHTHFLSISLSITINLHTSDLNAADTERTIN